MPESISINAVGRKMVQMLHGNLEKKLDADVVAVVGPIMTGAERKVRDAIEALSDRRQRLVIILDTGGGLVEVAERMVNVFRHYYGDVAFYIVNQAMSAGTVLAMSGDEIFMDFYSCLGPIDPQVERQGTLVPALSYLVQFKRLLEKSQQGQLTTAEYALLGKFDLAELHKFEEARELSVSLLVNWLTRYKFKDWKTTAARGLAVTAEMRTARAEEIARKLSDNELWHSHARPIPMKVLQEQLNLRVNDFGADPTTSKMVRDYFQLVGDFMVSNAILHLVHSREYL